MHAENDGFPDPTLLVGSADGRTLFLLTTDRAVSLAYRQERGEASGHAARSRARGGHRRRQTRRRDPGGRGDVHRLRSGQTAASETKPHVQDWPGCGSSRDDFHERLAIA